ncbi:MAG TPA: hypothetical protein PKI05_02165, partial [Thermogutta sp.]|nr:hypothetical protein [Thermogutta sp.]
MKTNYRRRAFLMGSSALAIGAMIPWRFGVLNAATVEKLAEGAPHAEKLGWRLGCQAYSFNRFTFYEAVEKTAAVGLRYIEAYPGQRLSQEKPDVKTDHNLSVQDRLEVKKRLADAGVTLVNYGVVRLSADEGENRKVFDFAKDMGIETIVSEPP